MRLENNVAIITGGSRGIGYAIAEGFLREGAKVAIASRKAEPLEEAAHTLQEATGGEVIAVPTHTADPDAVQNLIAKTEAAFGKVTTLVNNAATNPHFGALLTAEASHWDKIFDVNVKGYFWLIKYGADSLIKAGGGSVINVASIAGIEPGYGMGVYSTSKAAVLMMTRALAVELAPDKIRVNAIAPGFIKTKFSQALWDNPAIMERLEENTPQQRMADPSELAGAAIFLASDDSSFVTGETMVIDGGITITGS